MGALKERVILMTVWIERERKQRNTGRMKGCVGPLWCGCRRRGSKRWAWSSVGFPHAGSGAFPLATSSSCKIKKSLERWQLGQPTESPGGPASESCHPALARCVLLHHHLLQKVNNTAETRLPRQDRCSLWHTLFSNFSFSISDLNVLIWHFSPPHIL